MKLRWLILAVCVLLAGGAAAAVAASTVGTVSACATTPAQTISDNGAPIATVPATTSCATVTYTVPTATQTVTVGGTTAPATTTAPTTTAATSSALTYDSEIAYTQTRPAFAPTRTVNVSDATSFKNAIANLQAGDLVQASADFTVTGETIISARPNSTAVIDLSGHVVKFVYSAGSDLPAVWLKNPANLRIYGGDLSTTDTGGSCLTSYGGQNVTWWGFTAHDCGNTGFGFATVTAAASNDDFQGTIWKVGQNLAWDPHTEKGSGEHCLNMDDGGQYAFHDNRVAVYCHDIPTGAAIEYGSRGIAPVNNTIILKALNLTFVSKTQTGGNAIQFWGVTGQSADVKYLEVSNAQGYGIFDGGMYSGAALSGVTVEHGRASSTNLNPRFAGQKPWQTDRGVVYRDVLPAP